MIEGHGSSLSGSQSAQSSTEGAGLSDSVSLPPAVTPEPLTSTFSITGGTAEGLYPGAAAPPLDLSITNPNHYRIVITGLTVRVKSVNPVAKPPSPGICTAADYGVRQLSGSYPFTVGARKTTSLSVLGFSQSQLPRIAMLNRPYNQNGCRGAVVTLAYSGTATH